jgi:outer membrane protein TolC
MNEEIRIPRAVLTILLALAPAAFAESPPARNLTVRQTVEAALSRAPALAAARAAAREASASARLAGDVFHPELWFRSTPGYATGLPVAVVDQVPAVFGFSLRDTLYSPAARAEAFEAAAEARGRTGDAENLQVEIAESSVVLYARLWADQIRADGARRRISAEESISKRAAALQREGRKTDLELERVRLEEARVRQQLLDSESDLSLDEASLRWMTGSPAGVEIRLAEDPTSAIPEAAAGESLPLARQRDARLRALDSEAEALGEAAKARANAWKPEIDAEIQYWYLSPFKNYSKYYNNFTQNDFSVGVTIAMPIWSGGRLPDAADRVREKVARVEQERRVREWEVEMAVRQAEASGERARASLALALRAEGIARQALEVARLIAADGRGEADDVDRQQIALLDAEDEAARASLELISARAKLLALRGDLPGLGGEKPQDASGEVSAAVRAR